MNDTDQGTGPGSTGPGSTSPGSTGPGSAGAPPPEPPPPPAPRPPLRRRRDDRVVAGVASGLAAYLNIDPALARIGFVVLLFAGGVGLPLYVAGWLLIPEADEDEAAAQQLIRSKGPGFWIGIGILVIVALALAENLTLGGGNWWPLVLIAAGVALWRAGQDDGRRRTTGTATPRPRPTDAPLQETIPMATAAPTAPNAPTEPPRPPVDFTPPPLPQRTSGILGRVTFALSLIAAGVTVLLDRLGVVDAHLGHVLAASLTVVGLGLLVGAWFGRARSLIFPGIVLVPMVIAASLFHAADIPVEAGFGERIHVVDAANEIDADGYELAAGQLSLRLEDLADTGEPVHVRADVGAGQLDVRVPPDAEVRVSGELGIGELVVFGRRVNGAGIDDQTVREGDPGAPVIDLELRVGVGQINVRDGAPSLLPNDDTRNDDTQEFSR